MRSVSFGGVKAEPSSKREPRWANDIAESLNENYLPTGLGRSYGDVALSEGSREVSSLSLNKLTSFNRVTGELVCESGVLLRDIQKTFVKLGWMLPVTPGTSLVTVGGAIANDVHGKDHHFWGTFGEHILSFQLVRSDGIVLDCSPLTNPEMFRATIGGLGLTGFISTVRMKLRKVKGPYFDSEAIPFSSLKEFFTLSEETERASWQASVAWFDCSTSKAGRGSFTRGNPSSREYLEDRGLTEKELLIPFTPPVSLVNKFSLDAFNSFYYLMQKRKAGASEVHYEDFYYPLDGISHWNRIYGPKGFFQYQSVVPMGDAEEVTSEMLKVIKSSGQGSFLAVLKTFGDRPTAGMLSFARHGVTLALDFPNRGEKTERLFKDLDKIVSDSGGALNPSKDARMSKEMFHSGFTEIKEFNKYRDPACVSNFSRRAID